MTLPLSIVHCADVSINPATVQFAENAARCGSFRHLVCGALVVRWAVEIARTPGPTSPGNPTLYVLALARRDS
jgi:hypothetical protein